MLPITIPRPTRKLKGLTQLHLIPFTKPRRLYQFNLDLSRQAGTCHVLPTIALYVGSSHNQAPSNSSKTELPPVQVSLCRSALSTSLRVGKILTASRCLLLYIIGMMLSAMLLFRELPTDADQRTPPPRNRQSSGTVIGSTGAPATASRRIERCCCSHMEANAEANQTDNFL
eukprot:994256-Rhodomonas_salina.1